MGIRSALTEDIGYTSAELVYGTPLRLPGSFFSPSASPLDPASYIHRLQQTMQTLCAVPPREPSNRIVYLPADLFTQSHVFVRRDAVESPLQSPYDGPYRVVSRTKKHFTIEIKGKHEIISVNRLKGAHLEAHPPSTPPTTTTSVPPISHGNTVPVRTTHSGRRVSFPNRLHF